MTAIVGIYNTGRTASRAKRRRQLDIYALGNNHLIRNRCHHNSRQTPYLLNETSK